jgi:hypothetical protein
MIIRFIFVILTVFLSSIQANAISDDVFWEALRNNDVSSVITLVKSGYSPDHSIPSDTPLCYSIRRGYTDLTNALLQLGADPNLSEPVSQYTPLMVAAKHMRPEVVEPLLARGANVNQTSVFGRNALHMAALYNSMDVARLLLRLTAIETNSRGKLCPLAVASRQGYLDFVKMMIQECSAPFTEKCLNSAKDMAEYNHHGEVLEVLQKVLISK